MTLNRMLVLMSLGTLSNDLRQVCRRIRKGPGFAGAVILVLAGGFGISTAVFSIVRSILLKPLSYKNPERLVQIVSTWQKSGDQDDWSAPLRDAIDWKATVPAFHYVAMYRYNLVNLTDGDTCFRSASHRPESRTVAVGPQASGLRIPRELLKNEQTTHKIVTAVR